MPRFSIRLLLALTAAVALVLWLAVESSAQLEVAREYQRLDTSFWSLQTSYDYYERDRIVSGSIADVYFHFRASNVTDGDLANFERLLGGRHRCQLQIGWTVRALYLYDSTVTASAIDRFEMAVPCCRVLTRADDQTDGTKAKKQNSNG